MPGEALGTPLLYEEIARGYYSGYEQDVHLVITERAMWQELWSKTYASVKPEPVLPFVDFSRHTIVAAFTSFDEARTPSLAIEAVREHNAGIIVEIKEIYQGKHCRLERNKLLGEPFLIVKIKKTDKEISFRRSEITQDC